jgi:hypothetical protein
VLSGRENEKKGEGRRELLRERLEKGEEEETKKGYLVSTSV